MVDLDKSIEMSQVTANSRVALKSDSYVLHKILPNKVLSNFVQREFTSSENVFVV